MKEKEYLIELYCRDGQIHVNYKEDINKCEKDCEDYMFDNGYRDDYWLGYTMFEKNKIEVITNNYIYFISKESEIDDQIKKYGIELLENYIKKLEQELNEKAKSLLKSKRNIDLLKNE